MSRNSPHQTSTSTTADQISNAAVTNIAARFDAALMPHQISLSEAKLTNQDIKASGKRGSAVLMLFCHPDPTRSHEPGQIVFIKRSTRVNSHKGQIGFPGGRCDADDESPEETALRETTEEIGISRSDITVIGQLPPATALDGSLIIPVVGITSLDSTSFQPNPDEVDYAFTAPWTDFQYGKVEEFTFKMFGVARSSFLYSSVGHRIWGLTAGIIANSKLS